MWGLRARQEALKPEWQLGEEGVGSRDVDGGDEEGDDGCNSPKSQRNRCSYLTRIAFWFVFYTRCLHSSSPKTPGKGSVSSILCRRS